MGAQRCGVRRRGSNTWAPGAGPWVGFAKDLRGEDRVVGEGNVAKTSFPPVVHTRTPSTREKTKTNLPPPWVEHGIFRLQGERINHYATEAGGNQHFWDVKPIQVVCKQARPGKPGGGAAQRKAGCRRNSRMSPSMAMAAQVSRCSIGCSCFPFERQCTRRSRIVLST